MATDCEACVAKDAVIAQLVAALSLAARPDLIPPRLTLFPQTFC